MINNGESSNASTHKRNSQAEHFGSTVHAQLEPVPFHMRHHYVATDPTERFMIDGDSLVMIALCDKMVDWRFGGQFLSGIYQVERFLISLLDGGRQGDIVFFKQMEHSPWYCRSGLESISRRLFRALVIRHLQLLSKSNRSTEEQMISLDEASTPLTSRIQIFSLAWDQKPSGQWNSFLRSRHPAFAFVAGVGDANRHSASDQDAIVEQHRRFMQHFIVLPLTTSLKCYSLRHVQFKEQCISTFVIEPSKAPASIVLQTPARSSSAIKEPNARALSLASDSDSKSFNASATEVFDQHLYQVIVESLANLCTRHAMSPSSARFSIFFYACIQSTRELQGARTLKFMSRMLLLHAFLLDSLPLNARAFLLSGKEEHFASQLCSGWFGLHQAVFLIHLKIAVTDLTEQTEPLSSLIDVFDGRLFVKTCLLFAQHQIDLPFSHSNCSVPSFGESLWSLFIQLAGLDTRDEDYELFAGCEIPPYQSRMPLPDPSVSLTPIQCAMTQNLLQVGAQVNVNTVDNIHETNPLSDSVPDSWESYTDNEDDAKVCSNLTSAHDCGDIPFTENYHWHSGRVIHIDDISTVKKRKERLDREQWDKIHREKWWWQIPAKREERWIQKLQKSEARLAVFFREQGNSLLNVKLAMREIIAPSSLKIEGVKTRSGGFKKRDTIRQQNLKEKLVAIYHKLDEWIAATESLYPTDDIYCLTKRFQAIEDRMEAEQITDPRICLKALRQQLEWIMKIWRKKLEEARNLSGTASQLTHTDYQPAITAYSLVSDMMRRCAEVLQPADLHYLQSVLCALGFEDAAHLMVIGKNAPLPPQPTPQTSCKTTDDYKCSDQSKPVQLVPPHPGCQQERENELRVGIPFVSFQLQYGGPAMPRDLKSTQDHRVTFFPDEWQRKLLDVVDAGESAVVVAPTSAGKTFISYYCMKQVITHNLSHRQKREKQFVVYVAPTKALVNQMTAEVHARYGDIVGVFTRDQKHRVDDCQVLVTVPQCLDILLLSPPRQQWRQQLKYVIFDEVHCIGDINGGVYERLLPLVPCSFLALSATIANSQDLYKWVAQLQDTRETAVSLITYNDRWADLEAVCFLPDAAKQWQSTIAPEVFDAHSLTQFRTASDCFFPVHPLNAALASSAFASHNPARIQPENSLSARQAWQLWVAMKETAAAYSKEDGKSLVQDLDPTVVFGARFILRSECQQWSRNLQYRLQQWGSHDSTISLFNTVISELDLGLQQLSSDLGSDSRCPSRSSVSSLILLLHAQQKLPAIGFCFSRRVIELYAEFLSTYLEELEANCPDIISKRQEQSSLVATEDKIKKQIKRVRDLQDDEKVDLSDEFNALGTSQTSKWSILEAEIQVLKGRFSLLLPEEKMSTEARNFWLPRVLKIWSPDHPLLRALERGIGVHHAALPKPYRDMVEILFRARSLKVVFATGTLALGVNMPCKTAIFLGDSPYLSPLSYRQMSGRAGRRGYDNVGHVVFVEIPPTKVKHIISASIPKLRGHSLIDASFLLRAMVVVEQSARPLQDAALQMSRRLIHVPFAAAVKHQPLGSRSAIQLHVLQTQYLCRYYQQFLLQQSLVNEKGQGCGLAGLASHLGYTSPANFVFTYLLQLGIIDEICQKAVDQFGYKDATRVLLRLLCHLFNRIALPLSFRVEPRSSRSLPSLVRLDVLDDIPRRAIENYNHQVMQIFSQAVLHFATQELLVGAERLPLSNIPFVEFEDERLREVTGGYGRLWEVRED